VKAFLTLLALSVLVIGPCNAAPGLAKRHPVWLIAARGAKAMAFAISSTSFPNGGDIARKFTCDGDDVSPELSWTRPPAGTQTFALIADDPDAPVGTWTHWLAFDLPPLSTGLPENVPKIEQLPNHGGYQGRNDFGKVGYGGPCPPAGKAHHYFFKLYALDRQLKLKSGASKQELERAMRGHILCLSEWVGRYRR
jgi:Raf kinase inhibitor-like YbhB/YbcL family protein